MRRSSSVSRASSGAGASGVTGRVNAMRRLVGSKIGVPASPSIWNASPLRSIRRNQVEPSVSWPATTRRDVKARRTPSVLHRGLEDSVAGLVSRVGGSDPSVGAIHTSECVRFSDSSTRVRSKATLRPSGDTSVLPTPTIR